MRTVVVRQANGCDIVQINEMMLNSLSHCGYTQVELCKIMDLYKIDEEYLAKCRLHLAYHNEIFFGFFSFIQNTDQENELDYFIIRKDLIGQNYGSNMWEVCCSKARSLMMKDFIIMSAPHAEGFYQKMGAIKVGSCPSKIRPGVSLPLLKISL